MVSAGLLGKNGAGLVLPAQAVGKGGDRGILQTGAGEVAKRDLVGIHAPGCLVGDDLAYLGKIVGGGDQTLIDRVVQFAERLHLRQAIAIVFRPGPIAVMCCPA